MRRSVTERSSRVRRITRIWLHLGGADIGVRTLRRRWPQYISRTRSPLIALASFWTSLIRSSAIQRSVLSDKLRRRLASVRTHPLFQAPRGPGAVAGLLTYVATRESRSNDARGLLGRVIGSQGKVRTDEGRPGKRYATVHHGSDGGAATRRWACRNSEPEANLKPGEMDEGSVLHSDDTGRLHRRSRSLVGVAFSV